MWHACTMLSLSLSISSQAWGASEWDDGNESRVAVITFLFCFVQLNHFHRSSRSSSVEMGSLKFDSLPEDVLIQILLYKPKIKQPKKEWRPKKEWNSEMRTLLSISHTNRALRRLALSTPCLWATLTIEIGLLMYYVNGDNDPEKARRVMRARNEGVLNLFRLWIERPGEVPLNYKIDIRGITPAANDLINLFFEQKYRWRSAKVLFAEGSSHLPIPSSGLKNMPCLQELV